MWKTKGKKSSYELREQPSAISSFVSVRFKTVHVRLTAAGECVCVVTVRVAQGPEYLVRHCSVSAAGMCALTCTFRLLENVKTHRNPFFKIWSLSPNLLPSALQCSQDEIIVIGTRKRGFIVLSRSACVWWSVTRPSLHLTMSSFALTVIQLHLWSTDLRAFKTDKIPDFGMLRNPVCSAHPGGEEGKDGHYLIRLIVKSFLSWGLIQQMLLL